MATAPFLFEKLKESYAEQLPFVAYKIANQNTVKAVFQKDAQLHLVKDYTEEGFVFAPFDSEQAPVLFPKTHSYGSALCYGRPGKSCF